MATRFATLLRARWDGCTERMVKGECLRKEDQGYQGDCAQYRDDGRDECGRWEDQCCDWQPCALACGALVKVCVVWVWVSHWVCVAYHWVSHWVCVAWQWTKYISCVAWAVPATLLSMVFIAQPERLLSVRPRALRFVFAYDGLSLLLVSQHRVEMTVPPADVLRDFMSYSGFWYELRDPAGLVLYRHVMHSPIRRDVEVIPEAPGGQFSRRPRAAAAGALAVLVPDLPRARRLVFYSSPPEAPHLTAQPFAEFEISGHELVGAPSV